MHLSTELRQNDVKRCRHGKRCSVRHGFTLLELLLTLALAIVLMTLVNSAFSFYVKSMDSSDAEMRRTMLANAVMQMIEDDLRATLHPTPIDTSALEELLKSTASSGGGGGGSGQGDSGSTDTGTSDTDTSDPSVSTEETTTEDTTALATNAVVLQTPGLVGNQYQVQID